MSRVLTFSRTFPSYHPKKGQPTYFVEKIWQCLFNKGLSYYVDNLEKELDIFSNPSHFIKPKGHTIRAGHRWKAGDKFSPRVWSGKPYQSKQIIIAPDIEVKKVWNFEIKERELLVNGKILGSSSNLEISLNDGLFYPDFLSWFRFPRPFDGQIICWNENINY